MSEFKGTPGPWLLSGNEIYTEEYGPHIGPLVVLQTHLGTTFDEDVANANLIAATPELLKALQEMVAIVKKHTYPQPDKPSSTWGRMEAAEAVISKALGQ